MNFLRRPRANSAPLFYGWYIALAGAGNNFLISAVSVWGFGVFIAPLRKEFGWSTAIVAAGFSIRSFQQGFLAPFTGVLIDRFGPRRMIIAGTLVTAAGFLVFANTHSIWEYFLASLMIAAGQSVGSFTSFAAAIMRWFTLKRGRAMGAMNAGNGAGYFLVPLIAIFVTTVGWRETLVGSAILVLVVGLPMAFVVRDSPEAMGLLPDGAAGHVRTSDEPEIVLPGATVREALHIPAFYLLALAQAVGGATVNGWVVHTIPHLEHVGFSLGVATSLGVIYAACQLLFRPLSGVIGDRVGRRRLMVVAFLFQAVGIVVFGLLSVHRLWLLPVYYLTFAFGQATWVVLQAAMVADYFGPRRFGTINGLVNLLQMPVGVLSPIAAGMIFDRMDTYLPIFVVYSGCSIVAAVSISLIRRPLWTTRSGPLAVDA